MENHNHRFTRGTGLLEPALASLRAKKANQLIPTHLRSGRILDVGCGSYPYFLSHTSFKEKFAIDQNSNVDHPEIQYCTLDLNQAISLPYPDEFFSVVSMLAVIEHLNPANLVKIFKECHRILTAGGVLIMTTPSPWSDGLLKLLAKLRIVSPEEINEHVFVYSLPLLGWYFGTAGFPMMNVQFGYFELMLNMWAVARKD